MPLAEKLDPRRSALIVVDVQNDFCAPDRLEERDASDRTR